MSKLLSIQPCIAARNDISKPGRMNSQIVFFKKLTNYDFYYIAYADDKQS